MNVPERPHKMPLHRLQLATASLPLSPLPQDHQRDLPPESIVNDSDWFDGGKSPLGSFSQRYALPGVANQRSQLGLA